MREIKVSIIVPVYNSEKYLEDCLNSLFNQSLKDIEIICVNNGSTDSSLKILNRYKNSDDRFIVISQENKGVSDARNIGIKNAKGEYITFLDSDDWLDVEACEKLYNTAKSKKSDILLFSHYRYSKNSVVEDDRLLYLSKMLNGENTTFDKDYESILSSPLGLCGKFYLTSLIKNNSVCFPTNINFGEDRVFFINACINSKAINAINSPFYYYRINTENSLSKNSQNSLPHSFKADELIRNLIISADKLSNKEKIYKTYWEISAISLLLLWNNCYNSISKKENLKYLKMLKKEALNKNKSDGYKLICKAVWEYKTLFIRKLLEPIIELEFRKNRFVLYLFNRQVINLNSGKIFKMILNFQYSFLLRKLRKEVKKRKIKVAFWYYEPEKWSSIESLYREFEKSEHFEPIVYLSGFNKGFEYITQQGLLEKNTKFLDNLKVNYKILYDTKKNELLPIEDFKADIIFYQLPWAIPKNQGVVNAAKFALTCYVPYCYYSLKSNVNYMTDFHGILWKYFVETDYHKEEYEKDYGATNCEALGSVKLDNYRLINPKQAEKNWKTSKKRIIYAPHHSIEASNFHNMATFLKNGEFILKLAKKYQDKTEWIFRPHFVLRDRLLKYGLKTQQEIDDYYKQWENLGKISSSEDNYYEQFITSDCLITDCISFLSEYLPANKPVLHLRSDNQAQPFNDLLQKITEGYYQIYDNETLETIFLEVIINGNDYLKDKRTQNMELLKIDKEKTTAEKIIEYLEKELGVKG